MADDSLVLKFGAAIAIGLVVGVERGWRERDQPKGSRTAGVRTYGLASLLGAVSAAVGQAAASPALTGIGLALFAVAFATFKLREAVHDREFSVTGLVAGLVVSWLGALCVVGDPRAAAAGGIATAGLLASRELLHTAILRLTWIELRSALLLLAMTVVVLPLLPDRPLIAPAGVNLREIWLFTILTAAISYAGYVAVRFAGPVRGMLITGVAGALVSSTAVTIAFARRAAAGEPAQALAGGAALAGFVSIARVCVLVTFVAPELLHRLAGPALVGAVVFGAAGAFGLSRRAKDADGNDTPALRNPFDVGPLLIFAALFATVSMIGAWLTRLLGSGGLLASSAVFGLVDVDAAALAAARASGASVSAEVAAYSIFLALIVNAIARTVYAMAAGPIAFWARLMLTTVIALAASGATAWLLEMWPALTQQVVPR